MTKNERLDRDVECKGVPPLSKRGLQTRRSPVQSIPTFHHPTKLDYFTDIAIVQHRSDLDLSTLSKSITTSVPSSQAGNGFYRCDLAILIHIMAPDEERPSQDSRHNDAGNPFIAFRRFADEQVSGLIHTLLGQPQKSTKPTQSASDDDLPWIAQAMTDDQRRRLRSTLKPEPEPRTEAYGVPTDYFPQPQEHNAQKPEDEIARCPYRPDSQEVPERNRRGPPPDLTPRTCCVGGLPPHLCDAEVDHSMSAPWVVHYLDRSPYSPHHLEAQELLRQQGTKWRDAFEDLLALQNGLSLPSEDSPRRTQCDAHWVQSMLEDGLFGRERFRAVKDDSPDTREDSGDSLGSLCDFIREAVCHVNQEGRAYPKDDEEGEDDDEDDDDYPYQEDDKNADDDQEVTELDWYERMLRPEPGIFPRGLFRTLASEAFGQESQQTQTASSTTIPNENGKPGVISTLTTTERTTLPDGSMHTKMVLKKRFADGREESTETTHTTNGQREEMSRSMPALKTEKPRAVDGGDEMEKPKGMKSSGWFWN